MVVGSHKGFLGEICFIEIIVLWFLFFSLWGPPAGPPEGSGFFQDLPQAAMGAWLLAGLARLGLAS